MGVMGDYDELAVPGKILENIKKISDVPVIQGCSDFVKDTEWRRLYLLGGKQQGHSCHASLSSRKERQCAHALSWWLGQDLNT